MRKSFCLLPLAAALLLSGCVNLAPDYTRPEAPVAAAWPQDEATASATVLTDGLAQWGDFFTDPRMRELIRLGLMNNRDLRSATYAVEQARAQYGVSRADLFPTIAAAADDPVIQCNHTPHWDLALRGSLLREKQSLAHHVFIQNRSHTSTAGLFTHHTRKRPIRQHPAPPRKKSPPVML